MRLSIHPVINLSRFVLLSSALWTGCASALFAQSNFATPYAVSTLAGVPDVTSTGFVDGTGSAAKFAFPTGVAVDSAGVVYVADEDSASIRKITPAGVVTTLAHAGLGAPEAVAVDTDGTVYVCDTSSSSIKKVSTAGVVTTFVASGAVAIGTPRGIVLDASGNAYVANTDNYTILKITKAGVASVFAGSPQVLGSADGTGSNARFNFPSGVTLDKAGNLYVADSGSSTIRKITPTGVVTTLAGSPLLVGVTDGTGAAARFNGPSSLAMDPSGNIIVADTGTNTIRKITPAGVVTSLAGGKFGGADGVGSAASFFYPRGIAVDKSGNFYVADTQNNAIRKGTPPPQPPTITSAGTASGVVGTAFSYQITATQSPKSFALTGTLPTGVAFNATTGVISGTPTQAGTFALSLRATNALGTATASLTLTIPFQLQTITFPAVADSKAGLTATLAATASSGLPVSYKVESGPATISANKVTFTGAGSVVVAADQAGGSGYQAAPEVKIAITVAKGTQTISAFAIIPKQSYSKTPLILVLPTATSGLPVTVKVKSGPATLSGTQLTLTGLGAVTLTADQAGNSSFAAAAQVSTSFVVAQGTQTITFPAVGVVNVGQKVVLKATSTSGLAITYTVASGTATVSGSSVTFKKAGTVRLTANCAGTTLFLAAKAISVNVTVK